MDASERRRIREEIEFSMLDAGDLGAISHLITGMSNDGDDLQLRDKSAAYYQWMYYENPAGPAFVCVARHGDRIVSSFAVAPKLVQIHGRPTKLGKTMDMFTDPDYQGLGLIKGCADRIFAAATDAGIHGWYVTPSPNSYPIFKGKWGYVEPFSVAYRARILRMEPVLGAAMPLAGKILGRAADRLRGLLPARKSTLPPGWSSCELSRFDDRVDALWREVAPGYQVAIIRDAQYLNWRYIDNPDDYTVLALEQGSALRGLAVVKQTRRKGVLVGEIVDLVVPMDTFVLRRLIRLAVERLRALDCALVEAWAIPGTKLDRRLIKSGLAIPRTRVKFLLSPGYPNPLVYEKHAWLVTQGDGNDV